MVTAIVARAESVVAGLAYQYLEEAAVRRLLEVLKMPNLLEQMIADRLTQGIEQGRAEGRAEGQAEQREMARSVIRSRFGAVPAALDERITHLESDALRALVIQAATAERLEDLL